MLENLAQCILNDELRTQLYINLKTYRTQHLTDVQTNNLQAQMPDVRFVAVSNISSEAFLDILKGNIKRFRGSESSVIEQSAEYGSIVNFINIECSAAVVNLVKSMWLKKCSESKKKNQ